MSGILIQNPNSENVAPKNVGRIIVTHLTRRANQVNGRIKIYNGLRDLYKLKDSSVVHITTSPKIFPNSKFLLHFLSIITKKKLIFNLHGDTLTEAGYRFRTSNLLDYKYQTKILSSADRIIVNSYKMSDLLRSKYNLENDVVIPNGIEDWWFNKSDLENKLTGDPAIFYHGRLWSEKGIYELIKGFSKGIKDHSTAKLYIAGNGPQDNYLKKLCVKLKMEDSIIFLGLQKKEDLKNFLINCDAAIYPSLYEPFSLSILEAFAACNGPVFYSKSAGIDDFVVKDGYKFHTFFPSVEEISQKINCIIEGNYTKSIQKSQKEFAKKYLWSNVTDNYIELYNNLLEN